MKRIGIRILSALLCIVMSVTFASCAVMENMVESISSLINPIGIAEDISLGYTEIDSSSFIYSKYYDSISCTESYNALENDAMRALYDMLYDSAYFVYPQCNSKNEYKCKQVILENAKLTQAQIRLTIKALTDDNPHIFWLTTTFGFLVSDDYTAVQLYSRYSPDDLAQSVAKLKVKVNEFFSSLEKSLTPYQLELEIHDFLLERCEYDKTLTDVEYVTTENASAFDPYGVMVKGLAVCEGYSRTFQLLLNGVGIDCILINGESQGELHMWNAVKLDGDWYYVDVTWDDMDDESIKYDYFNISEKVLSADHEFSKLSSEMSDEEINGVGTVNARTSNFFIPTCDQRAYNYYVRNCAHLIDYIGDEVVESLLTAAMNKEQYFHFYIDPRYLTYEYAVDQLFYSYPQYFFGFVDTVNYSLSDYSIDNSNLSLSQKDSLSVVTVALNYV